jgi:hypothetical protein
VTRHGSERNFADTAFRAPTQYGNMDLPNLQLDELLAAELFGYDDRRKKFISLTQ